MANYCCAYGCGNGSDITKDVKFHKFPLKNLMLTQKWIRAIRLKNFVPTKSTTICSNHFLANDYLSSHLKNNAVPSVFDFDVVYSRKSTKILEVENLPVEESVATEVKLEEVSELNNEIASTESTCLSELKLCQSQILKKGCNKLFAELGLDSSRVEVYFETNDATQKQHSPAVSSNKSREDTRQTRPGICRTCQHYRMKIMMLRRDLLGRNNKIKLLRNKIAILKKELENSNRCKIKIVGNRITLLD